MAEIYANGDQIISSGELIYDLANDYLKQINTLFNSLSKLEQTAWSGNSASTYVAKLADATQYTVAAESNAYLTSVTIDNTAIYNALSEI